jgi:WD40 repeat protein
VDADIEKIEVERTLTVEGWGIHYSTGGGLVWNLFMDTAKPVQPTNARRPASWWSARRVCAVLTLLFVVTFAASWWLTPIEPYATLNLGDECGLYLFSPDGTTFVTAGTSSFGRFAGPLRVWDVEQGRERLSVAHGRVKIDTVRFSPDSSLLAANERGDYLKLWNARTGEEVASIGAEAAKWIWFQFSPDGRFLVFLDHSKSPDVDNITFWNIETKRQQGSVEGNFHTLRFAPDGHSFATFRRKDSPEINEVLLWKMDQVPVLEKQHQITASQVVISPDLKTFATADDLPDGNGQVAMWDMMTGEKRWSGTFNERIADWWPLSFIANGKVLSAQSRSHGHLRTTLWDVTSTPKEIGSYRETTAISPDGEWLAISSPDAERLAAIPLESGFKPLDSGVKLIKVSAPGRGTNLIVNGDVTPGHPMAMPGILSATPSFSPDSKLVLVTGLIRSGHEPFLGKWLPEKYNPFRAVADVSVFRLWDTDSRREVAAFYNCVDAWFSPDGKVLATLRDDTAVDLWKVPLRASLWRSLGWAVIVWLIVVSVGWVGVKIQRKMFSRINAPIPRPESSDRKQPPDPKEPPLPHDPPPPPS